MWRPQGQTGRGGATGRLAEFPGGHLADGLALRGQAALDRENLLPSLPWVGSPGTASLLSVPRSRDSMAAGVHGRMSKAGLLAAAGSPGPLCPLEPLGCVNRNRDWSPPPMAHRDTEGLTSP